MEVYPPVLRHRSVPSSKAPHSVHAPSSIIFVPRDSTIPRVAVLATHHLKPLQDADVDAALKPEERGGEVDEDENEAQNNHKEDEDDQRGWARANASAQS